MIDDAYFRWPPGLRDVANDDVSGFILVLIGVSMILWVLDGKAHISWNRYNLIMASVMMALLTIYQFLHWVATGIDTMPWISNAVILSYIIVMARRSDSGKTNDGSDVGA
ncbi:hypothetical protein FC83_GL000897 [Agrilactobacillus composti DSM 18527 = JCM 14202]|uniref:Uncharacterized protein n=2 Tax=Agrilactobacillus TaxID=2767875 RepID=X0QR70_9LACO|nr:hypothetical protein FC83_GL000897 [Agrilactobacillus composti DSM 18527 = JCM 14202]GAF41110.1 hypothetical protein JCM14202_3034 [Agrilactobacillus composti DSM 18527 = JCM 14202]